MQKIKGVLALLGIIFISILIVSFLALAQETRPQEKKTVQTPPDQTPPQEVQKPKLDYMSTFLSRTTNPLGLKEDQELRQLLRQSRAKWAVRAGLRHILN